MRRFHSDADATSGDSRAVVTVDVPPRVIEPDNGMILGCSAGASTAADDTPRTSRRSARRALRRCGQGADEVSAYGPSPAGTWGGDPTGLDDAKSPLEDAEKR